MKIEEKIRLAVISGASHALNYMKKNPNASAEDAINSVSENMRSILDTFGERNGPNNIISLAALTGASRAAKYAERNNASDREALKHVSDNMQEITSNLNKEE